MLRDRDDPMDLFALLPTLSMAMEPVVAQLDRLLDEDVLFRRVKADLLRRAPHTATRGRPSTPVEGILRMECPQIDSTEVDVSSGKISQTGLFAALDAGGKAMMPVDSAAYATRSVRTPGPITSAG